MAWRSGEQIGAYRLEQQLGQGGMATVYKAYHTQLDRHVAIKVMHQNFLDDETFTARFQREAQIVARLSHPHIVPVYDYDQHEGLPFLVMKYVPGVTLKKRLIKKPPVLDEILAILTAVGSALDYAHQQGILHRDIKPSNIVLDLDETPYLTDFGLARLVTAGESTMSADMLLGTPHYISPEQARGKRDLDGRTDVYSLGIVLYELLVGHVPYTGDTPYSIIHDHIYTPLPRPSKINPEIPAPVEDVLYQALTKQADERYETAGKLVDELRQAIAESRLTDLNPERSVIAAQSLADMRADLVEEFNQPPPPTTQLPPMTPTVSPIAAPVPTGSIHKKKWHENERIWPVSGCAVFLIMAFFFLWVSLNMSSSMLEFIQLANQNAEENPNAPGRAPLPFSVVGVELSEHDYSLYLIPTLEESQARELFDQFPEESLSYLLLAKSIWRTDAESARDLILNGLMFAEDETRYLASAAFVAEDSSDTGAALVLAIFAWQKSVTELTEEQYADFRPMVGNYVYQTSGNIRLLNYQSLLDTFATAEEYQALGLNPENTANPAALAIIRNYVARGGTRFDTLGSALDVFIENAFTRMASDPNFQAEALLLRGEYARLQDDLAAAERAWDSILNMEDVPEWIEDRAEELLNQLPTGED
jgi:serine/threonine protein kinase